MINTTGKNEVCNEPAGDLRALHFLFWTVGSSVESPLGADVPWSNYEMFVTWWNSLSEAAQRQRRQEIESQHAIVMAREKNQAVKAIMQFQTPATSKEMINKGS